MGAAGRQEGGRAADAEAVQGAQHPVPGLGQVDEASEAVEEFVVRERFEGLTGSLLSRNRGVLFQSTAGTGSSMKRLRGAVQALTGALGS